MDSMELNNRSSTDLMQGGGVEIIHRRTIDGARGIFEAMVRKTNLDIDGIKREAQRKERDRRFDEELKRQKRYEEIQAESQHAARAIGALDLIWSECRNMKDCQELAELLNDHKEKFKVLVNKKKDLIKKLESHLDFKDDEYVRELEVMKQDIDVLVEKMRSQFQELRELSKRELKVIEEDLIKQRSEMLAANKTDLDDKFASHRKAEEDAAESRRTEEEEAAKSLENLRVVNDKRYMDMKIKAEILIQNCEKCYEDMRALYQLNSEKLSYNYKVLKEKKEENDKLQSQLKTKEQDYSAQYKSKKDAYTSKHDTLNKENKKLTKQYTSLSAKLKSLHKKFKHFVQADTQKFEEIRKMNLDEINKMKERIKHADQIIHQHQLGVVWEPFNEEEVIKEELGDEDKIDGLGADDEVGENQEMRENNGPGSGSKNKANWGSDDEAMGGLDDEDGGRASQMRDSNKQHFRDAQDVGGEDLIPEDEMHAILNLMLFELDFLLDDKVRAELDDVDEKEQLLIKLNVVRKVLAVKDESEMTRLLFDLYTGAKRTKPIGGGLTESRLIEDGEPENVMNADGQHEQSGVNAGSGAEEQDNFERQDSFGQDRPEVDEEEEYIHKIEDTYDPNLIIEILTKFIEVKKNHVVLNSADHHTKKLLIKKEKEKNLRDQKIYIAKMSKVLPNERLKMWRVLEKISSKYYQLLLERQRDIVETTQLHTQNDELKNLLRQYTKVNHNLRVPPTDMLNINFTE